MKLSNLFAVFLMSLVLAACAALTPTPMYSNNADLSQVIDDRVVIQLIDDERAGFASLAAIEAAAADSQHVNHAAAVQQIARIDRARATGDEVINTYLRTEIEVPLDPVPVVINQISADMTVYFLHKRRGLQVDMSGVNATYRANIQILEQFRAGKQGLGVESDGHQAVIRTNKSPGDRRFNFRGHY